VFFPERPILFFFSSCQDVRDFGNKNTITREAIMQRPSSKNIGIASLVMGLALSTTASAKNL
jgi:hypothetical protein